MKATKPEASKLFRAIVIVGASLGATACTEHGKSPPDGRQVSDASKLDDARSFPDAAPTDVILIL